MGSYDWIEDAACRSADWTIFFPEKGEQVWQAKSVCKTCGVVEQCLEYALDEDIRFGVWGGLSENERYELRRRNRVAGGYRLVCAECDATFVAAYPGRLTCSDGCARTRKARAERRYKQRTNGRQVRT